MNVSVVEHVSFQICMMNGPPQTSKRVLWSPFLTLHFHMISGFAKGCLHGDPGIGIPVSALSSPDLLAQQWEMWCSPYISTIKVWPWLNQFHVLGFCLLIFIIDLRTWILAHTQVFVKAVKIVPTSSSALFSISDPFSIPPCASKCRWLFRFQKNVDL